MPDVICWKAKDNEEEGEEKTLVRRQINNMLSFSGHKFVWHQLWGLVTHSWIIGDPEKRTLSTLFSYNLHTFTYFSTLLFLTIGLWVRPSDTAGFQESYQRYCEMKYVSVTRCDSKGDSLKLNEQLRLRKLEQGWCAFEMFQKEIFAISSPFCL